MRPSARLCAASALLLLTGCATSSTHSRSYTDPTVGSRIISSLAILPIRNAPIAQSESIRLNREIAQTVQRQNSGLRVIGPVEAVDALNKAGLVDDYDRYLTALAQSGIPNAEILQRVGSALGADAIMQGQIVGLIQSDGYYPGHAGTTKFSLRYSIVSAADGLLLWETSADVQHNTATVFEQAPPLETVLADATATVLKSIPQFTFAHR